MAEAPNFLSTKRYAVVTGSNKGIGFEICRQLASKGVTVVLTSRDEKKGKTALKSLQILPDLSNRLVYHQLDVTDPKSIDSLVNFVKTKFGKLDILVNNAGIAGCTLDIDAFNASGITPPSEPSNWERFTVQSYEDTEECLKTNYYGVKRMSNAMVPLLQLSDSPRIVNVSSYMGNLKYMTNEWAKGVLSDTEKLTEERIEDVLTQFLKDFKEGTWSENGWPPYFSAYRFSKALVNTITRAMAKKYPSICINSVCPGAIKTDINSFYALSTVEYGAENVLQPALMPHGGDSGVYFDQREAASPFE
ncbi:hypothetical protein Nepgr_020232 [Nepenthes gracilis]|uniref:Uncharacterized protein n=1 Tax=Nepenthes gracilis TaxID=150966 RepID=A0AAD3XW55_NEPGR|nr:hypothetical protein Nepgr_020232 [Nepenthes gracilis]